ncbi:MAG: glucosaminidase domain-containing protein [Bacillota bacterium]
MEQIPWGRGFDLTGMSIGWGMEGPDRPLQAVQARLRELEPGFGGRVTFRFGAGCEIGLRLTRAPAGRSVTASGEGRLVEPLLAAVGRQLRPWGVRPARCRSGPAGLVVGLAEGDESRPHLLAHLAEGIVLGLAGALGERFSFPLRPDRYEERDLTAPARLEPAALDRALAGTGLEGLGAAFCRAEEEAGVNSLALAALAAWESAWGRARIAREQQNLLGWAEGPDPAEIPSFPSAAESITAVAPLIRERYLTPGGPHFCGANLIGMNVAYTADPLWRHGVAALWRRLAAA